MKASPAKRRRKPAPAKGNSIAGLGRLLVSSLDRKTIFQELARGLKGSIPYHHLAVFECGERKEPRRVFVAPTGQEAPANQSRFKQAEKRISSELAQRKRTFRWVAKGPKQPAEEAGLLQAGFHSYLGLPLIQRRRVIGSLHVARKGNQAYSAEEFRMLVSVSEWLTIALANTLLYETVKGKNHALQKATEYKSQFLARMSHEIRTPLGVLIGFLDILHAGTLGEVNEEQKNALDKMQSQSRRLQKMINDVLNLSRIEEGSIPLEVSAFALEKIIDPLKTLVDNLQRQSQLKVFWDIDSDLPTMTTDAPKLEEILQNLIVNAFKYTREGEVRIRIKNKPETSQVEFVVEDTGLGISPQNVAKIFEGFHQIDATNSSKGVGLGLTIVKKYLDLLDGDIQVLTQPGKGSSFYVTLPYTLEG